MGQLKTTLGVGDQVVVTATFSKNVTVGNNANYTFNLDSDKHRVASYVSGSGSNSLIFFLYHSGRRCRQCWRYNSECQQFAGIFRGQCGECGSQSANFSD